MRVGAKTTTLIAIAVGTACGGVTSERIPGGDGTGGATQGAGGASGRAPGNGFCGDGVRNGDEPCDLGDFGGETCESATSGAARGGQLRCTNSCSLDISHCNYGNGSGGRVGLGGAGGTFGSGGSTGGQGTGGSRATGGSPFGTGATDAGSVGDPHVRTLDGLKYDFQAVGEFILLEDRDDPSFVIQIRQTPFLGLSTMSVNTAVAASVSGDRVAFYAGADPPLRIDGVPREILGSAALRHGGEISNDRGTYIVRWPTGEELDVVTTWKALVNVGYRPSENHRRAHVRGLLGNDDDISKNDLTTRSGKSLHFPSRPNELYGVFGRSYRIRRTESLFDYSAGETTATFTDLSFPLLHGSPPEPPITAVARAQRICEDAGVTDPNAIEACAVDVAITGDFGFARAAAGQAQRR